ncbi:MAG: signal peptidase I [Ardenticatenales bacterium]
MMSAGARRYFGCGLPALLAVAGLASCGLLYFASAVFIDRVTVPDDGMTPLLAKGEEVLAFQTLVWSSNPVRGTLASMKGPDGPTFRRVVAVPGDRVAVRDGTVYIDGQVHDPPAVRAGTGPDQPEIAMAPGMYFVVGDNRDLPDSRTWGPVGRDAFYGEPQWVRPPGGEWAPLEDPGLDPAWRRSERLLERASATATAAATGGR